MLGLGSGKGAKGGTGEPMKPNSANDHVVHRHSS